MKKTLLLLITIIVSFGVCAQGSTTDEYQAAQSSYERFMGASRNIVKLYSYKTPKIYCKGSVSISTDVRKIVLLDDSAYYYRLSFTSYSTKRDYSASLTYKEVGDLLNAIELFTNSSKMDVKFSDVYIENYYKNEDGFKLGYYTNNGTITWFIRLNDYTYSSNTIKDINQVVMALINAKSKIEYIM